MGVIVCGIFLFIWFVVGYLVGYCIASEKKDTY